MAISLTDMIVAMDEYQKWLRNEKVSPWAVEAWGKAGTQGVFDTKSPRDFITREQAAITYVKTGLFELPLERLVLEKLLKDANLRPGNHITLAKLKGLGFDQISEYYAEEGTENISKVSKCVLDTKAFDKFSPDPRIARHFRPTSEWDIKNLNMVFTLYGITTPIRKAVFFSQIAYECGLGKKMAELADLDVIPKRGELAKWFNAGKAYGYKYRGGGATHLTWKTNYEAFRDEIKDEGIVDYGCEYVAFNYPWLSAGWYWHTRIYDKLKINDYADMLSGNKLPQNSDGSFVTTNQDYRNFVKIVAAVTGGNLGLKERAVFYNSFLGKV